MAVKLCLSNHGDKVATVTAPTTEVRQDNRFSRAQMEFLKSLGVLKDYDTIVSVISMDNGLHREVYSIIPKDAKTLITDADVISIK